MEVGMGQLGLAPSEFWRCTFREMTAILNGRYGHLMHKHLSMKDVREAEAKLKDKLQRKISGDAKGGNSA